jgi:CHRD domain-containing protein
VKLSRLFCAIAEIMRHHATIPFVALLLAAPLFSQSMFRADLNGDQLVNPVVTSATAWATLTINPDGSVTYLMEAAGLIGTASHIHRGAVGVSGSPITPLVGGPTTWSGTTAVLAPADLDLIRAGDTYILIHTAVNPMGEIRGQVLASPNVFSARVEATQMVPPSASTATGVAQFVVNPDRSVSYDLSTTGLSGLSAEAHFGEFGMPFFGLLFSMAGGPTDWSGTSAPISAADFSTLQQSGVAIVVHSSAFILGEIRGQLFPTFESYGFGTRWSGGDVFLSTSGAPMQGRGIDVQLSGGVPNGSGVLAVSLAPAMDIFMGANQLVQIPTAKRFAIAFDASGQTTFSSVLPMTASKLPLYAQYWGSHAGSFYNSNALLIEVQPY